MPQPVEKPSVGPQLIAMPTKHRVMTLRDDIVFFIYLYQRYLYPVDKTRPNEFGRAYEEEEGSGAAEKQANPAAVAEQEGSSTQDADGAGQDAPAAGKWRTESLFLSAGAGERPLTLVARTGKLAAAMNKHHELPVDVRDPMCPEKSRRARCTRSTRSRRSRRS